MTMLLFAAALVLIAVHEARAAVIAATLQSCPPSPTAVFPSEVSQLPCVRISDSMTICNSTCTPYCSRPVCTTSCPGGAFCGEEPQCEHVCATGVDHSASCPTCDTHCCELNNSTCTNCIIECEPASCTWDCGASASCIETAGSELNCTAPTCAAASALGASLVLMVLALVIGIA